MMQMKFSGQEICHNILFPCYVLAVKTTIRLEKDFGKLSSGHMQRSSTLAL